MRYLAELRDDPFLREYILMMLPPVPEDVQHVIRCSRDRVDQAVARAIARAAVRGEISIVQTME
jgi:hypothetical protein